MSNTKESPIIVLVKDLMRRRECLPSQLAKEIGRSHPTVGRWLTGEDVPSTASCGKLAAYSGIPVEEILGAAGHLPAVRQAPAAEWPEFREYASRKYPDELDEDTIIMIEDLIERRRKKAALS